MVNEVEDFFREYNLIKARKTPSKIDLRTHQTQAIKKLMNWFKNEHEKYKGGILVLPTGGGKTFTAIRFLCQGPLSEGYKVLWLAHTHHLLEQAFYSFGPKDIDEERGYEVGFICEPKNRLNVRVVSGNKNQYNINEIQPTDDVLICTLQSISRGYKRGQPNLIDFINSANGKLFVVFDEAHHSPAPSYRKLIQDLRNNNKEMFLLGLTATPTYSNIKRKGWLKELFPQDIIYQTSINKLMAVNILAQPKFEKPKRTHFEPDFDDAEYNKWINTFRDLPSDIIDQLANNRSRNQFIAKVYSENKQKYNKTLIFADRWNQCVQLCEFLKKEGVRAGTMFSHVYTTPTGRVIGGGEANAKILQRFKDGELDVLVNIRMLTEGTDVPDVNTVFLTRQTTSKILLTQMIGRSLRGTEFNGTAEAYIVSFIDDWKQKINWAEWDPLQEGGTDIVTPPPVRNHLELISIDLVRRLSRIMYSNNNIEIGPFLNTIPVGWYQTKFYSGVQNDGEVNDIESEDYNEVNRLVLVFEEEKSGYNQFIDYLKTTNLSPFEEEEINKDEHEETINSWYEKFFGHTESMNDINNGLFYIACHMAQNDKEKPLFFSFNDRNEYDIDVLAHKYMELGATEEYNQLKFQYERKDRYWNTIYPSFELFKQQYDACVNRILNLQNHKINPPYKVKKHLRVGPTSEIKRKVKEKYPKCLACGEERKNLLEVDHINSRYFGGKDDLDNLQTLCIYCNSAKNTQDIDFRNKTSYLQNPPSNLPDLVPPKVGNIKYWKQYVQRIINFYYYASVVKNIDLSDLNNWKIELNQGNNKVWIENHMESLTKMIQSYRDEQNLKGPNSLIII